MEVETLLHANPYVGPRPFERANADAFFGRTRETDDLFSLVVSHAVLLVYAQSGAGKTSLINAGLRPLLEEDEAELLPQARVRGLIPDEIPSDDVANVYVMNTLISWAEPGQDVEQLAKMTLAEFLSRRERKHDKYGYPVLRVLIFDQFEELFTFYQDRWRDREAFFHQLAEALEEDLALRIVLAMREDFIARLDPFSHLMPDGFSTRYRLERLRADQALQAITGPLSGMSRRFAPGVAEMLVDELRQTRTENPHGEPIVIGGEFVEPVQLQVVCDYLWQELPPEVDEITADHVQHLGDVDQALANYYERALRLAAGASGVSTGQLRQWFETHLITSAGTRGTVNRGATRTGGIPNQAVEALEDLHVIRGEWRAGARWYELTHDRLIGPVQQANEPWRLEQQELEQRRALEAAQADAEAQRQRAEAEASARRRLVLLAAVLAIAVALAIWEWSNANASRAQAQQAEATAVVAAREAETQRQLAIAEANSRATAEAVANERQAVAEAEAESRAAAEARARESATNALTARDEAERLQLLSNARGLAFAGMTNLTVDPELTLLLALQAIEETGPEDALPEALDALHEGLQAARVQLRLPHEDVVREVIYSPNGDSFATGGFDNNAYIWDAKAGENQEPKVLTGHTSDVLALAYSPDGQRLATASYGSFKIWDTNDGIELLSVDDAHVGWLYAVPFHPDPDQNLLATVGDDGYLRLWEIGESEARPRAEIAAHVTNDSASPTYDAVFSPDGESLATASDDWEIKIWDLATILDGGTTEEALLQTLKGHHDDVYTIAFSPDGSRLLSGSRDRSALLWDLTRGRQVQRFQGHSDTVFDVTFTGNRITTASADGTIRIWDPITGEPQLVLAGHDDLVWGLDSHPTEPLLLSGSADHNARVWYIGPGKEVSAWAPHPQSITRLAMSEDNRVLAAVGYDDYLALWDATSGQQLRNLVGHTEDVWSVALNSDGTRLASGGWAEALVYSLDSGELLHRLVHGTTYVTAVGLDETGRRLVTGGVDGTLLMWDVDSGTQVFALGDGSEGDVPHPAGVYSVGFRNDGLEVISVGYDGLIMIWDAQTGVALTGTPLSCGNTETDAYALNSDATLMILGDIQSGEVRLCDVASGEIMPQPARHDRLWAVGISSEGGYYLTFGEDGTVRVWDLESGEQRDAPGLNQTKPFSTGYISSDGRLLALVDVDGRLSMSDVTLGRQLYQLEPKAAAVTDVHYLPEEPATLVTAGDRTARVWTESGQQLTAMHLGAHRQEVWAVDVDHDENLLATAGLDSWLKLWDLETGELQQTFVYSDTSPIVHLYDVALHPERPLVAAAAGNGMVPIWDLEMGERLETLSTEQGLLFAAAFNPTGSILATAGETGSIKLWETDTWTVIRTLQGHDNLVFSLDFSTNGERLVSAGRDWYAIVWDVASGDEVQRLEGHTGPIEDIAFSPDGRQVATASWDRTVLLWDVESGEILQRVARHDDRLTAVAFSPAGSRLATAGADGTVRIHALTVDELVELAHQRLTRPFSDEECRRYLPGRTCSTLP